MRKTWIYIDKPILVGQAILDKSKELMYEFYYDYLKSKYGDKVKLLYIMKLSVSIIIIVDTDSFILTIQTDDFFEDIKGDLK